METKKEITFKESPQMAEIFRCFRRVCETDWPHPDLVDKLAQSIIDEYHEFHSPLPPVKGSENWKNTRVRLLYAKTVKIDFAFRKRAERHVRSLIQWELMFAAYEAMAVRKQSGKAVRQSSAHNPTRNLAACQSENPAQKEQCVQTK